MSLGNAFDIFRLYIFTYLFIVSMSLVEKIRLVPTMSIYKIQLQRFLGMNLRRQGQKPDTRKGGLEKNTYENKSSCIISSLKI